MLNVKAKDELLKQLKLGFKRTFNWNKYQSKTAQAPDLYLDYLIEPNFHWVNGLFVLTFDNNANTERHARHYLSTITAKDYNVMINGKKLF